MPAIEPTTTRQRLAYEDTVDIYAPTNAISGSRIIGETTYSSTPIATGQKCMFVPKREILSPHVFGRFAGDQLDTQDSFKMPDGVTIDDSYVLELTTEDHPLRGAFWIAVGEPERRASRRRRHNASLAVYVKRVQANEVPAGLS